MLRVDNGGIAGTNTPLSSNYSLPAPPFDLNISGAATVVPLTPLPLLSNLTVSAGSTLTMPVAQSNLVIAVLNNATVAGSLNVDHLGYAQTNGPGAGSAVANKGSGGGYGGIGGPSSTGAPGGTNYGSATQPVDFGSGGGNGAATITGGSEGGGALRLSVAGALNVDGNVSANGNPGWQDDSGGGAGGSVWISAGTLSGAGNISAMGGSGAPLGGGGGGGGRIAIYTPDEQFYRNHQCQRRQRRLARPSRNDLPFESFCRFSDCLPVAYRPGLEHGELRGLEFQRRAGSRVRFRI